MNKKKLKKAEEVKVEKSGVKLTDEELEQVTGGGGAPNGLVLPDQLSGESMVKDMKFNEVMLTIT